MSGEAYVKRYPGGFVDLPATSTAIDSSYLNGTEAALARLLGADPVDANLMVWDQSLGRFKTALLANAHVAAAAAISRTKLDFGAGLLDADIAPGAAVAQSKIAGLVVGLASRPTVTYDTTLPASPTDGQEVILVDSLTAPTYTWRFRWVAGISDAYKWVFVGGASLYNYVDTSQGTTSTTFTDLATVGPSITLPRAGIYLFGYGAWCYNTAAAAGVAMTIVGPGVVAAGGEPQAINVMAVVNAPQTSIATERQATVNAAGVVKLQYLATAATANFSRRFLRALPVRVS